MRANQLNSSVIGQNAENQRYVSIFIILVLLVFGIYHSVLYFGHTVVPIGDFPAFTAVGHELWSFKMPSSFKRAPVLGLLLVPIGWLVGGPHPDLTAGWLLNAVLHPLNAVLLWLLASRIIGKAGAFFAVIAILNPTVMYLLTEPIVETTLLFFILLTFYFVFKRSNWCYVLAAITTMVRFEGAVLIIIAFVMDMIYAHDRRQRIRSLLYSASACIPLGIWMAGTFLSGKASGSYLALFGKGSAYAKAMLAPYESQTGFLLHIKLLWQGCLLPLLQVVPGTADETVRTIWKLSQTFALLAFLFGSFYGLFKRRWEVLALLLFILPYYIIHANFPAALLRYYTPVFWIVLLLSWYGAKGCWELINARRSVPTGLVIVLQAVLMIVAVIWLIALLPYLPKLSSISPPSGTIPYVSMVVIGLIIGARLFICRSGHVLRELSILAVMCLFIVSNQFYLAGSLGDGQKEAEFKFLAQWYVKNTQPGEKMGLYMFGVVQLFVPENVKDDIVPLPKADDPSAFVKACQEEGITYVVWASREGLSTDHAGYRQLNLDKNIAFLREPKNIGPYEFVTQIKAPYGYVNIFRLNLNRGAKN